MMRMENKYNIRDFWIESDIYENKYQIKEHLLYRALK